MLHIRHPKQDNRALLLQYGVPGCGQISIFFLLSALRTFGSLISVPLRHQNAFSIHHLFDLDSNLKISSSLSITHLYGVNYCDFPSHVFNLNNRHT